MSLLIDQALESWVNHGGNQIGEVSVWRLPSGDGYRLCHVSDAATAREHPDSLEFFSSPRDARLVSQYGEAGDYRPLKTAPTLRRGWLLELADAAALREAMGNLYPAMVPTYFRYRKDPASLPVTHLRDTLNRQTGMYRYAREVTDEQAQTLVRETCNSAHRCLKKNLWQISEGLPITSLPPEDLDPSAVAEGEMPLLCTEACTFIVSGARKAAKEAARQKPET